MLQKESKPISQGGTCSGVLLDESDEQGVMNYIQGFLEDCGWRADRGLAETYAKYSGEAIRWMQVRTAEAGFPPYMVRPTAVTEYEDGSKCSAPLHHVRPQTLQQRHHDRALGRYGCRARRGVLLFHSWRAAGHR